jgi:hypothetical protein
MVRTFIGVLGYSKSGRGVATLLSARQSFETTVGLENLSVQLERPRWPPSVSPVRAAQSNTNRQLGRQSQSVTVAARPSSQLSHTRHVFD